MTDNADRPLSPLERSLLEAACGEEGAAPVSLQPGVLDGWFVLSARGLVTQVHRRGFDFPHYRWFATEAGRAEAGV